MKYLNLTFPVFILITSLYFLTACDNNSTRSAKVRSIGNTSEILVVVENEQQWETSIGDVIREYLGRTQYGLNQEEPIFDLAHVQKNSFTDLFKKHRNLLIVDIDQEIGQAKVEIIEDYWSKPQKVIRITAPSAQAFATAFKQNAETFRAKYNQAERERILTVFNTTSPNEITAEIKGKFGIDITIPRDFYVAKTTADFMWLRKETEAFSQGFILFSEPYQDTAQFSQASIIARLNRFQKQYIPGAIDGSYMATDDEYVPPKSEVVSDFSAGYAVETRGLWKVEGDFMSGPFLSYTFVNPGNNQIITLTGYVYQPNKEKRNLLRQMEAMLYSAKLDS